jgi:chemotaxis protein MotB
VLTTVRRRGLVVQLLTDKVFFDSGQAALKPGARSAAVVRMFVHTGVLSRRISLAGYADEVPLATNATAQGRSRNRRVEVVLTRQHSLGSQGGTP